MAASGAATPNARSGRDHDRRVFGSLALVDRRRIGWHDSIQLPKAVADGPAVKTHAHLTLLGIDIINAADIPW